MFMIHLRKFKNDIGFSYNSPGISVVFVGKNFFLCHGSWSLFVHYGPWSGELSWSLVRLTVMVPGQASNVLWRTLSLAWP